MSTIYSREYKEFIRKLKEVREKKGLTQVQVSNKLNKPQSYISKIETCQRRLDVMELKQITDLYGVEISNIL